MGVSNTLQTRRLSHLLRVSGLIGREKTRAQMKGTVFFSLLVHYCMCSRYSPGKLQTRKWENALTIDKHSWGWNRNATISDYMTVKKLVDKLVEVVAYNGNMLLNVGPGPDGTLSPVFVDRLLGIGMYFSALRSSRLLCGTFVCDCLNVLTVLIHVVAGFQVTG